MPTRADQALARRLADHDIRVTPVALIGWRQAGLLTETPPGGRTAYPANIIERTSAAQQLVASYPTRLDEAVLAMFAEGQYRIDAAYLKRAYRSFLGRAMRDARSLPANDDEALDGAAQRLAKLVARDPAQTKRRQNLPRKSGHSSTDARLSTLTSVTTNILSAGSTGKPLGGDTTRETILYYGGAPLVQHLPRGEAEAIEVADDALAHSQHDAIDQILETLDTDSFYRNRQTFVDLTASNDPATTDALRNISPDPAIRIVLGTLGIIVNQHRLGTLDPLPALLPKEPT